MLKVFARAVFNTQFVNIDEAINECKSYEEFDKIVIMKL